MRGLHYQAAPRSEVKVVRCTEGAMFDVLLDLRPDLPTYRLWTAVELSAANRRMVYIPKGVAHGFQTLTDDTEALYQITQPYDSESSRGVRWNDPASASSGRSRSPSSRTAIGSFRTTPSATMPLCPPRPPGSSRSHQTRRPPAVSG